MSKFDLGDYVEVKDRITEFRAKYPEGTLQSEIVQGMDGFITVKAYAYRSPDDPTPGTGLAWEPVPGATPYTKNSELQNAETSAWGRAIIAVGAADASKGIGSREEARNRREEPARQDPVVDAADWLKRSVQMLKEWDDDERRQAYTNAMKQLAFETLTTKNMNEVFDFMAGAYYEAHPASDERPL